MPDEVIPEEKPDCDDYMDPDEIVLEDFPNLLFGRYKDKMKD